jgi:RNA polymerase sigma-70 factor (ECF subfamily)
VTEEDELAAGFETQRSYLHAIAFRVLGSHADADDAVQEAWLRLARTGGGGIEDLRGWLTTVTGRICLDVLRRRGARAEQPLEISAGMLAREAAGHGRTGPEGTLVVRGAGEVAARATMGARPDALGHPALIDGAPGVLITVGGRPVMIMAFTVGTAPSPRSAR